MLEAILRKALIYLYSVSKIFKDHFIQFAPSFSLISAFYLVSCVEIPIVLPICDCR